MSALVVQIGDSIAAGQLTNGYNALQQLAMPGVAVRNMLSMAGHENAQIVADMAGQSVTYASLHDPTRTCIIIDQRGTNDVGAAGRAPAIAYGFARTEMAKAKAAGWYWVQATLLPRFDFLVAGYNAIVVANSGGADFLLRLDRNPDMGPQPAARDTAKYSDGLHPTIAGQDYLKPTYRQMLEIVAALPPRPPASVRR